MLNLENTEMLVGLGLVFLGLEKVMNLGIFTKKSELSDAKQELNSKIDEVHNQLLKKDAEDAKTYMVKTDVDKKLDDFKKDVHSSLSRMEKSINSVSDQLRELTTILAKGIKNDL